MARRLGRDHAPAEGGGGRSMPGPARRMTTAPAARTATDATAAPGHTPGPCAELVDRGNDQLLHGHDAAHHTLLVERPD